MSHCVYVIVFLALLGSSSGTIKKLVDKKRNLSFEQHAPAEWTHNHTGVTIVELQAPAQQKHNQSSVSKKMRTPDIALARTKLGAKIKASNGTRRAQNDLSMFSSVQDSAEAVDSHDKYQKAQRKENASRLLTAYGVAMVAMITCVSVMFYPMGKATILQIVLYVGCLAIVKIALKIVYEHDFHYPKFITSVHLMVSSIAGFVVLFHRKAMRGKDIAVPTPTELFFGILPIASTYGLSIASENSALILVSAAFSEVVASTNPVMSFVLTWILGMGSNLILLAPIATVMLGCVISVEGEIFFSAAGLALLLLSIFFRGLKAVMQQMLMTGATRERFDPVTLMSWSCMFAFVVVFGYALATEGLAPLHAIATAKDLRSLIVALFGSAASACALNISALFVIKQLGAVGIQMVSQMKSLLVVIGGMALLGESFTHTQQLGFSIVLFGVYWYSRVQRQVAASASANAKGR